MVSLTRIVRQILSRANLEAAAANQVKGKVENVLEQKTRVSAKLVVFCSCWPSQFHDPHPNVRNNVLAGRIMVVEVLAATTMSAEVRTHTRLESHAVASALFDFPL